MAGYSTDEEYDRIEEDEMDAALNELLDVSDNEYWQFDQIGELDDFLQKMTPGNDHFKDVVIAHIQAALTANGDKIASGLLPEEMNDILRSLSGGWIDMNFLAEHSFPANESVRRNTINMLHQDQFTAFVEQTSDGRYRIKETDDNREMLSMMKEGAFHVTARKDNDYAKIRENESPENSARFMHGCNFLSFVIKVTCDIVYKNEVEWQDVQKVYTEMVKLRESECRQTATKSSFNQNRLGIFKAYCEVLNLDHYEDLDDDLMKHISGREKAVDALCEPLFANIGMKLTNDEGGFTVHIKDSEKEYSKEHIDKVLQTNDQPDKHISKTQDLNSREVLSERKSTYSSEFSSLDVITETPSTYVPKPTPSGKTDVEGAKSYSENEDSSSSTFGFTPHFANVLVGKHETSAESIKSGECRLGAHEDGFSVAAEMDGNTDNLFSDDEDERMRRTEIEPFARTYEDFDDDDSETEEEDNGIENSVMTGEPTRLTVDEKSSDEPDTSSTEPSATSVDATVQPNISPSPIEPTSSRIIEDLSVLQYLPSSSKVSRDVQLDYMGRAERKDQIACKPITKQDEQERIRYLQMVEERVEIQSQREYEDRLEAQRVQEKADEVYARELCNQELSINTADEILAKELQEQVNDYAQISGLQTSKNFNQRVGDYNDRKTEWSNLGYVKQECSGHANRREWQPELSRNNAPYQNGLPRNSKTVSPELQDRVSLVNISKASAFDYPNSLAGHNGTMSYHSSVHGVNRNVGYQSFNIASVSPININLYDVSRPGSSNSYNQPNIDVREVSLIHDITHQQTLNSPNPQGDVFRNFIKFYMIMFVRPATEIQWSKIVDRCNRINSNFRFKYPKNMLGPAFVNQLLLPDFIQVFPLDGSHDVIFVIGECDVTTLGDLRVFFVEFMHAFMMAFNPTDIIRWLSIAEINILRFDPDAVFETSSGNWVEKFNVLAKQLNIPLKAHKPKSEIYFSVLAS